MAVNTGNEPVVSGRGAKFENGMTCLCDLMQIFFFFFRDLRNGISSQGLGALNVHTHEHTHI